MFDPYSDPYCTDFEWHHWTRMDAWSHLLLQALEEFSHPSGTLLFHALGSVGIGAEGERGRSMTQVLLDGLDIVTSPQAVDSECVAQIMEPKLTHAQLAYHPLVVHVQGFIVDIAPGLCGEHEILPVVPIPAQKPLPALLPGLLIPDDLHDLVRHGDGADLVVLQAVEPELRVPLLYLAQKMICGYQ